MVDAVGVALGVVGVVGTASSLFATCMDAFDRFKTAENLGQEFQVCNLKLAVLQLRLLRWRASFEDADGGKAWLDEERLANRYGVIELLKDMSEDLRTAERLSSRYQQRNSHNEQHDEDTKSIEALAERVKSLARQRQRALLPSPAATKRITWALQDRKTLNRLIDELTYHVDSLEELLPPPKDVHERQTRDEAHQLFNRSSTDDEKDVLSTPWVGVAVSSVDEELGASLKQEMPSTTESQVVEPSSAQVGSTYHRGNTISYGDVAATHQGNVYYGIVAKDAARVQYGDAYGGRSIFDD